MKKTAVLLNLFLFSLSVPAALGHSHEHKSHDHGSLAAHVHGKASLAIALEDDNEIEIKLEIPGDTVVGFEHKAKSRAEKKQVDESRALFKKRFAELVVLPAAAECSWKGIDVDVDHEHGHSTWEVEADAKCAKSAAGLVVEVKLGTQLPKLDEVQVMVLGPGIQKQVPLSKGNGSVSLTK